MQKSCLAVLLFVSAAVGCSKVRHETSVICERANQRGEVLQQVVRERTIKTKRVFFGADGPTDSIRYEDKYFIRAKDNSRRAVRTRKRDEFRDCGVYRPVEGTPYFVGAGVTPVCNSNTGHVAVINGKRFLSHYENDFHIVVFDERGISAHRTFSVVPRSETSEPEFTFGKGNRTIFFRSPTGAMTYNLVGNAVMAAQRK